MFKYVLYAVLALTITQFSYVEAENGTDLNGEEIGQRVASLLKQSDKELNYLALTLQAHTLVDPSLDYARAEADVKAMAAAVRALAGPDATNLQLLTALRQYVYQAGAWNENRPFSYDMSDPLGTHLPNKLLPNYLESRQGNCVSMPILYVILGEELGLDMTLAAAPNHVFVHYEMPDGRILNLETTSGANPARNEWYKQNFQMSDKALENGLYLKKLNRRETAAIIATVVLEDAVAKEQFGTAIYVSNALLVAFPNYDAALIQRGLAFQGIIMRDFIPNYPRYEDIPEDQLGFFHHLRNNAEASFGRVEALGYLPQN